MTVGELFETLTGRLTKVAPVEDICSAVGIVSDHLSSRLFLQGSPLLRREVSLTFPAGVSTATMPFGTLGMVEPPFVLKDISKGDVNLLGLESGERVKYVGQSYKPERYEIVGKTFRVFPTPDQTYKVVFEASVRPERPETFDDDLPFDGLFDHIFREVVLLVMLQGGSAVVQADAFLKGTFDAIDRNRANRTVRWRGMK